MSFRSYVSMAVWAIARNKLRSSLTVLGVVIGVGAVIALVNIGQGASAKVTDDISSLGQNMLVVRPGTDRQNGVVGSAPLFDNRDFDAIQRELAGTALVAPSAVYDALCVYGNANWRTLAIGSNNDYFTIRNWEIDRGRAFEPGEVLSGRPVCVIGQSIKENLFGAEDPIGKRMRIRNIPFQVVGVLKEKGRNTFGDDQDDLLIVPIKTFHRRFTGDDDINVVLISAANEKISAQVQRQVTLLLRERRRLKGDEPDDFSVRDLKEIVNVLSAVTGVMTALIGSIAGVSLLVGGIGIMNIMLVSVTERTREIGVRLAIGARARDVLWQFLIEAMLISVFGGAIGIAVGILGTYLAALGFGIPFVVVPEMVVGAFVFSAGVGVFFGFYPALKASRLDPIDALRHE